MFKPDPIDNDFVPYTRRLRTKRNARLFVDGGRGRGGRALRSNLTLIAQALTAKASFAVIGAGAAHLVTATREALAAIGFLIAGVNCSFPQTCARGARGVLRALLIRKCGRPHDAPQTARRRLPDLVLGARARHQNRSNSFL